MFLKNLRKIKPVKSLDKIKQFDNLFCYLTEIIYTVKANAVSGS